MTALEFTWSAPPHVPREATVVVREALLPMLMWPAVPVVRKIEQDLTITDRFLLEAALALAPMRTEDVAEVIRMPAEAVSRIAGRLTGLGLLRADGADYYPVPEETERALEKLVVPEFRTSMLSLLYLPDGDDLIAYRPGPGQVGAPLVHRFEPVSMRPFAEEGVSISEWLRERIISRQVAGLPDDIVDLDARGEELAAPSACPVFRCRGHVRGEATLVLEVLSGRKTARCTVAGAEGQAEIWAALARRAPEVVAPWPSTRVAEAGPVRWACEMDGAAAEAAVHAGVAVSRMTGVTISDPPGSVVAVSMAFAPADVAARRIFALDQAVCEVVAVEPARLTDRTLPEAAARASRELGVDDVAVEDVLGRLWDDFHFRHIYALRENRDFAYD